MATTQYLVKYQDKKTKNTIYNYVHDLKEAYRIFYNARRRGEINPEYFRQVINDDFSFTLSKIS